MDTSDFNIKFNHKGICDHCETFYSKTLPSWNTGAVGKKQLSRLSETIKKDARNKDFDCVIGMSGGIDSSYLVFVAKEILGLRPLVFHVDAGWNSQIAVNNIEKIVDGLNLELFTEVVNWEEVKDLQRAFFRSGVPHIDVPQDHAFFATMYKFANKHKIRHILTGANLSTECIRNPVEWMYYQSDRKQLLDIHKKFGDRPLRDYPTTSILWHKIWLPYIKKVKVSKPLNYIPYIKEDAKKLLMSNFGWQPYAQKHFESRFTKFYESYWLPTRFGYDVRRVQFSSLIVTSQMTREDAIEELEKSPFEKTEIDREREFIANKLDITIEELDNYMALPLKTYKDYKNNQTLYRLGAKVLHTMGLEIGGKR
jgi:N-acetyl sugar amidotransferase